MLIYYLALRENRKGVVPFAYFRFWSGTEYRTHDPFFSTAIRIGSSDRFKEWGRIDCVKGIGLKTAQRILVDLKNKVKPMESMAGNLPEASVSNGAVTEEAVAALVMLGFQKADFAKSGIRYFERLAHFSCGTSN